MIPPNPKFSIGETALLYPVDRKLQHLANLKVIIYSSQYLHCATTNDANKKWRWIYVVRMPDGRPQGWVEEALRPLPDQTPGEWDEEIFIPIDLKETVMG